MGDREILEQMIYRSINNSLGSLSPGLRMFSSSMTKYAMNFLEPYIEGFTDIDSGHINTPAATAFMKEETSKKIEDFMKKFESEAKNEKL